MGNHLGKCIYVPAAEGNASVDHQTKTHRHIAAKQLARLQGCVVVRSPISNHPWRVAAVSYGAMERVCVATAEDYDRFLLTLVSENANIGNEFAQLLNEADTDDADSRPVAVLAQASGQPDHALVLSSCAWNPTSNASVPAVLVQHVSHAQPSSPAHACIGVEIATMHSDPQMHVQVCANSAPPSRGIPQLCEALDTTSVLLTVCRAENLQVVYQNAGSHTYAGHWVDSAPDADGSYLHQLMALQPHDVLPQLLATVTRNRERWTRAVQVPECLSRCTPQVADQCKASSPKQAQAAGMHDTAFLSSLRSMPSATKPSTHNTGSSWLEQTLLDTNDISMYSGHMTQDPMTTIQAIGPTNEAVAADPGTVAHHRDVTPVDLIINSINEPSNRGLHPAMVLPGSPLATSTRARLVCLLKSNPPSESGHVMQGTHSRCGTPSKLGENAGVGHGNRVHVGSPRAQALSSAGAEMPVIWHEVTVSSFNESDTGLQYLVIVQNDVTARSALEQKLMKMTEAQLHMLENMFLRHILERLTHLVTKPGSSTLECEGANSEKPQTTPDTAATYHDCVTILFTDLVGFTSMSEQVPPHHIMSFLTILFSAFDELCVKHKVSKIETAGDCYIVCCGLLDEDDEGFQALAEEGQAWLQTLAARRVLNFATDMLQVAQAFTMPNGKPVQQRVGIHSGSVVCGLVGQLQPKFALFGDAMNTASRMESTSHPGHIQVSQTTFKLLCDEPEHWQGTGCVDIKGKGLMNTYMLRETYTGRQMSTDLFDYYESTTSTLALTLGRPPLLPDNTDGRSRAESSNPWHRPLQASEEGSGSAPSIGSGPSSRYQTRLTFAGLGQQTDYTTGLWLNPAASAAQEMMCASAQQLDAGEGSSRGAQHQKIAVVQSRSVPKHVLFRPEHGFFRPGIRPPINQKKQRLTDFSEVTTKGQARFTRPSTFPACTPPRVSHTGVNNMLDMAGMLGKQFGHMALLFSGVTSEDNLQLQMQGTGSMGTLMRIPNSLEVKFASAQLYRGDISLIDQATDPCAVGEAHT